MRSFGWALVVGALASSAIGCIDVTPIRTAGVHADPGAIDPETTMNDLPSGQATRNDFAVRVYRVGHGSGSCSGALVTDRIVVTALHCVVEIDPHAELTKIVRSPGELHVELGGGYLPWGRVGVVGIRTCGEWGMTADGDIAALTLDTPVPADVPILTIADEPPRAGDELVALGFGSEQSKLIPMTDMRVESVKRHTNRHIAFDVNDGTVTMSGGSIHGDSGGPIVDRATGQLVALVSEGSEGHVDPPRSGATLGEARDPLPPSLEMTRGARIDRCRAALGL